MYNYLRPTLNIALVIFLSSCGQGQIESKYKEFTGETYGKAFLLESSSQSCGQALSFQENDLLYFSEYLYGTKSESTLNYVAATNQSRKIFSAIFKGAKFNLYQKFDKNGKLISRRGTRVTNGETLRLCPEYNYSLEEGTYESAAASVSGILGRFLETLEAFDISIPSTKLSLYLSPEINVYNKFPKSDEYNERMVNNAFYNSKNAQMTFLPQGVTNSNNDIPYGGVPLWTLPFVPVHEYAHHIFSTNVPLFRHFSERSSMHHAFCFGKASSSNVEEDVLVSSRARNYDVYSAFNEGFADLIAFYGNGEVAKDSLKSVTCFEKNREVNSSRFYNGQDKRMGNFEVNSFLNKRGSLFGTCKVSVDYSSIHTFGALFANGFYEVSKELNLDRKTSLNILIDWSKRVGEIRIDLAKVATHDTFKMLLLTLKESFSANTQASDICQSMQKQFPVLYSESVQCVN